MDPPGTCFSPDLPQKVMVLSPKLTLIPPALWASWERERQRTRTFSGGGERERKRERQTETTKAKSVRLKRSVTLNREVTSKALD